METIFFLFANAIKIYQFKVNSSDHFVQEIFQKILQPELNGHINDFFVDCNIIGTSTINDIKITFGFIIKLLLRLLSVCTVESFGASLAYNYNKPIKSVTLNSRLCQARPTLVNINHDEILF